jgi:hypothetical protein
MRYYLFFLFAITIFQNINAQNDNTSSDINSQFKLTLDSVELRTTINRWGTDTSYFLYYNVKNISNDTLIYVTNTCFYYNRSSLKIENSVFDLNPDGGCYMNSYKTYVLSPGQSFSESWWVIAYNLQELKVGECNVTLSVPIIIDDLERFRVDGRSFVENKQYLIYTGQSKIINTIQDNRKRKKRNAPNTHLAKEPKS